MLNKITVFYNPFAGRNKTARMHKALKPLALGVDIIMQDQPIRPKCLPKKQGLWNLFTQRKQYIQPHQIWFEYVF